MSPMSLCPPCPLATHLLGSHAGAEGQVLPGGVHHGRQRLRDGQEGEGFGERLRGKGGKRGAWGHIRVPVVPRGRVARPQG